MFSLIILIAIISNGLLAQSSFRPQITTQGKTYSAFNSSVVTMECAVESLGDAKVVWSFLNQNLTISVNEEIFTADNQHYSVLHPNGSNYWNLRISAVSVNDVGYYECSIMNSPAQYVTHALSIQGVKLPARPDYIPAANFTDCCVKSGVDSSCLSGCSPSTVDFTVLVQSSTCQKDLSKIFQCSLDGRNHVPCCLRMRIPSECMIFCSSVYDIGALTADQVSHCMTRATDIGICIDEAQILIPSPPNQVSASNISDTSIFVTWLPPTTRSYLVQNYRVYYADIGAANVVYNSTDLIPFRYGHEVLTDLLPGATYDVYVAAISDHGVSSPSYHVQVTTDAGVAPAPSNYSIQDCCQARNVSEKCKMVLCGGDASTLDPDSFFRCLEEFNKSLPCYAEGRDHTACCAKRGIVADCLDFCRGEPVNYIDLQHLVCVYDMDDVTSCIMEGQATLPREPVDVRLLSVGSNSVVLAWAPPVQNQDRVAYYLVQYRMHSQYKMFTSMQVGPTLNQTSINYLEPNTMYDVRVLAANPAGTSAPSATIVLLTYPTTGLEYGTLAPPVVNVPYNETECCMSKNLPSECAPTCSYNVTMDDLKNGKCSNNAADILDCISGGRNNQYCCQARNVSAQCLVLCNRSPGANVTLDDCAQDSATIIDCMKEGVGLLPGPPRLLTVKSLEAHAIAVAWEAPDAAPTGVQNYSVVWSDDRGATWRYTVTAYKMYIAANLTADTQYWLYVMAMSPYGPSLPTPSIKVTTRPEETMPTLSPPTDDISNYTTNLEACCVQKAVSAQCQPVCKGLRMENPTQCASERDNIMSCAADGRNHSSCCKRREVSPDCIGYCEGLPSGNPLNALACWSYLDSIRSCFVEGYVVLPSPPTNFTVTDVRATSISLNWTKPEANGDNVTYIVGYALDGSAFSVMEVNDLQTNITGLSPDSSYSIYVLASNRYGTSLTSPTFSVFTYPTDSLQTVYVSYTPSGLLHVGQSVTLSCVALVSPAPAIHWSRGAQRYGDGGTYAIGSLTADDNGTYTCSADEQVQESLFLKIQVRPTVRVDSPLVQAVPGSMLDAVLVCRFQGFPANVEWHRNGASLLDEPRVRVVNVTDDASGDLVSSLTVLAVQYSDIGQYKCIGSTTGLGYTTGIIQLYDNSTTAPDIPAPAVSDVPGCCRRLGVTAECQIACQFDIDLNSLQSRLLSCGSQLPTILLCASDGKDHSRCCADSAVPQTCLPFCLGRLPDKMDQRTQISCLQYAQSIVECMEKGRDLIPSSPLNVRVRYLLGAIDLYWEPPFNNPQYVTLYEIKCENINTGEDIIVVVDGKLHSQIVSGLKPVQQYTVSVRAMNHHGASEPSDSVVFHLNDRPGSPVMVHAEVSNHVDILVKWAPPAFNYVPIDRYRVYYSPSDNGRPQAIDVYGFSAWLRDLNEYVRYTIYVSSVNIYGESGPSNLIRISTDGWGPAPVMGSAEVNNVGLIVGLVLAFSVIVVVFVLVIHFYCRQHPPAPKPSVSFENPAYRPRQADPDSLGPDIQMSGVPVLEQNGAATDLLSSQLHHQPNLLRDQHAAPSDDAPANQALNVHDDVHDDNTLVYVDLHHDTLSSTT